MSDSVREAVEIVEQELRKDIPSGGSRVVRAWQTIKAALSANGGEVDIKMGTGDVLIGDLKGEDFSGVVFYRDKKTFGVGQPHPEMSGVPCDQIESRIFSVTTSNPESLMVLRRAVDRALDHLGSPVPPSVAVPEGWKLVPVEPTPEMREAFHGANGEWEDGGLNSPDHQYQAMLTAAPSPDHSGDAGKVAFVDGVGAQRMTAEECKEGIEYIIHGDNIYWPLSDDDELRLIQAACGNGEFTYPGATPSVPENEIKQAKAIGGRDALLMMAKRHLSTAETHSNITAKITCQKLAKACQQQAARLRTAGDEGEEG